MELKRSKFEIWLEKKLKNEYPFLDISFNDYNAIGMELDVYIPELSLAFEINGILHYKPIQGWDLLRKKRYMGYKKIKACLNDDIDLRVINISTQGVFTVEWAKLYFSSIRCIIDEKLSKSNPILSI